jgi:hypothetical protein
MCWDKVCSDEFADQLAKELNLNFEKDDGGMFTDVFEYRYFVPEVTNISVGYSKQHSSEEKIDVLWLIEELIPSIIKVNWESLVSVRDHTDVTSNVANLYQNFFNHYDEKITEGQLLDEDDIDIDNLFSLDDEEELNLFGWQKRHDLNWCHFCWFDAEIVSKSDSECETFFCKNCASTVVVPYGTFDPEAPNNYESYSRVEHP